MPDPKYSHVLSAVLSSSWAMLPEQCDVLARVLVHRMSGGTPDANLFDAFEAATDHDRRAWYTAGTVGVLPLTGTIFPKANIMTQMSGATSIERWISEFETMIADDSVQSVVLDIDSPGGSVWGIAEASERFNAAKNGKPIVAVSNYLCASAAYWIASQADEIVASPSSITGSIGVYAMHQSMQRAMVEAGVDLSIIVAGQYKAERSPALQLTEGARAELQTEVNEDYDDFIKAVAKGRGIRASRVKSDYGEGRAYTSRRALDRGMVDRIASLRDTIERLQGSGSAGRKPKRRSESETPEAATVSAEAMSAMMIRGPKE